MSDPSGESSGNPVIDRLEAMLAAGNDSAVLRFGLGNAWLTSSPEKAAAHFAKAAELDPGYSAAWKALGKALLTLEDTDGARRAWESGLAAAREKGDMQAVREMEVFLRRLDQR